MKHAVEAAVVERRLRERLGSHDARVIVVHAETGSTNDDAKALAADGAAHGSLVVADAQTRGRGRSGNAWFSPPGANVYLSVLLRPSPKMTEPLPPFSLAVGLAVARAIDERLPARGTGIKWPNDVWVRGRKIAGVLLEASTRGTNEGGASTALVVGVGVNVATTEFPPELARTATSLAIEGASDACRSTLAADVAAGVLEAWTTFSTRGLAPFLTSLRDLDVLCGSVVRVEGQEGRASGIQSDGRLRIEREDGTSVDVVAGHVEIVRPGAGASPKEHSSEP